MIWKAKFFYAALKWLFLVTLITGIIMGTWLSRKMVQFTFACGCNRDCCCITHYADCRKNTVLHCDVQLEQSSACLRQNWLQHQVDLVLSILGDLCVMSVKNWLLLVRSEVENLAGRECVQYILAHRSAHRCICLGALFALCLSDRDNLDTCFKTNTDVTVFLIVTTFVDNLT